MRFKSSDRSRSLCRTARAAAGFTMRPLLAAAVLAAVCATGGCRNSTAYAATDTPRALDASVVPPTEVGMNLSSVGPYALANSFADLIKAHGGVWLVPPAGAWQFPSQDILTPDGRPVNVPLGTKLMVEVQPDPHWQPREIICHVSKGWRVGVSLGNTKVGNDQDFRIVPASNSTSNTSPIMLSLIANSNPASLDQLSCRANEAGKDDLFLPQFTENLRPFHVLRFMDWMKANKTKTKSWSDRPTPDDFDQFTRGVAVENMVALANQQQADAWFTLPLDADAEYHRAFATYVRDHLKPGLKVYVELSNEVWNTAFQQGKLAVERGKARYPTESAAVAADFYYADRLREVMPIWSEVFASQPKRLVRVAASQAAWPERAENILSHEQTWKSVDMLATAPYLNDNPFAITANDAQGRIDSLFARSAGIIDEAIKHSLKSKIIAAKYGLRYGTYEGGPGYVTGQQEMQMQLNAMARDPRMYDLYSQFLNRWQKEIGGLYVAYTFVDAYGKFGAWGHKEYDGQPLSEAPKMRALVDFIQRSSARK